MVTQSLLTRTFNESVATDLVQKGHDRTGFASSATSVRSLSTSSSAESTDLIRSPQRNLLGKFQNPVREIFHEAGAEAGAEETSFTVKDIMQVKSHQAMHKDYEVVFLGTGASIPSKYRNVSATLINMR